MKTKTKAKAKAIYRVIFQNQGNIYELYARKVGQSALYSFVEIEDIIFGERSNMLVDPTEERLKAEFSGVNRTLIPMQAIVRVDEVSKEGVNKIHLASSDKTNVSAFPMPLIPRKPEPS